MSNRSLVMKGASWIALARIFVTLIGLASTLILARLLVPEDFGLVAIAGAVTMVIASITELSLAQALVQHDDPQDHHYDTAWTLNNTRSILLSVLIAASAHPVATAYGDPRLLTIMLFLAGTTLIDGLQSPRLIVFQRNLVFWQEFALSVTEKLAGFIAGVTAAIILENYWALILGGAAARIVRCIASYIFAPYRPRIGLRGYKELLSFSVWLTFSKTVQMINWRADPLILGAAIQPGALGQYSMSDNLAGMPIREGLGPIRQTLFPAFSRIKNDMPRLCAAYLRAQGLLCVLALPIGTGFAAVAEPAVRLMLGEAWIPAVPMIQALALIMAFEACEGYQPLAMALGRTKAMFGREMRAFAVRLPLLIAGMMVGWQVGGDFAIVMGAIAGRGVASLINVTWNMTLIQKMTGITLVRQVSVVIRPLIASAVMFVLLTYVLAPHLLGTSGDPDLAMLLLLVVAGIAVYVAALLVAWVASGRPSSAEAEAIRMLGSLRGMVVRKARPALGGTEGNGP
ncbi:lipopolysaccharide biosynthesis protein [Falsirhodobacter sp. 1013]|uniref:lipopolysaccharide biosynthesis protein n=1 Tax=Falsirhodobacter sp. 1013 TaxID=3417566 RepID=UPI003EC103AC